MKLVAASTTTKVGLYLSAGLHDEMLATAQRLSTRKNPRGDVRRIYERAFRELAEAIEAGVLVAFPATRGVKVRISVRLSEAGRIATGQSADTDTVLASVKAYVNALNRLIVRRQKTAPDADVKSVNYRDAG